MKRPNQTQRHYANAIVAALRSGAWQEVTPARTGDAPMFEPKLKRLPLYLAIQIPQNEALGIAEGVATLHEREYRRALLKSYSEQLACIRHIYYKDVDQIACDRCRVGWILASNARPYRLLNGDLQLQVQSGYESRDHRVMAHLVDAVKAVS